MAALLERKVRASKGRMLPNRKAQSRGGNIERKVPQKIYPRHLAEGAGKGEMAR